MKKIHGCVFVVISCFSLFFPFSAYADSIKCYSGNRLIFSRSYIYDVMYNGVFFAFKEGNSDKVIFSNTNCIVTLDS